jgi:ATP-dependent DNA helicase Q1
MKIFNKGEQVAQELSSRSIRADCYHAQMDSSQRTRVHENWLKNKVHVIVATIAFGMGIDKSNCRFVIHHSMSKSLENFYQESGRAGRDGLNAWSILYYRYILFY